MTPSPALASLFEGVFSVLRQLQPDVAAYDVVWHGPWFVDRSGWHPSRFQLVHGVLYATIDLGWSTHTAAWTIGSDRVTFERWRDAFDPYGNDDILWRRVLDQFSQKLRAAVDSPATATRRVARCLPTESRSGTLRRRLTWPKGARAALSPRRRLALEQACEAGRHATAFPQLTVDAFLMAVAVACDAAFDDVRDLEPLAKYRRRADTRHGGLLNLPPNDTAAFEAWYRSGARAGAHPWEIVYGHPHGILLAPFPIEGGWRLHLSVETPGLYLEAVAMALALGAAGWPFELIQHERVVARLRGTDAVAIGPHHGQLSLAELRSVRPDSVARIRWERLPPFAPISREQARRVAYVLEHGTPAGFS